MTDLEVVFLAAGGWFVLVAVYLAVCAVDRAADHNAPLAVAALLRTIRQLGGPRAH